MNYVTSGLRRGGLIAGLTLFSCMGAQAEDVIKIGIPTGLSGANSVVAPSVVQSAELAVDEINAKGGISARRSCWRWPMTARARPARRRPSTR